jgi:hypothetical protein
MDIRDILKSFDQLTEGDSTVHKAGPGGYGNRHGTDDVTDQYGKPIGQMSLGKLGAQNEPKRGKGRPPNPDKPKSYDSSELNKAMGVGKAPKPTGKPSVKHSLKEYFNQMDEAGLSVQPMPATPQQKQQQAVATKPSFMIKDPANPNMPAITTQDPAVVQAAKNGTMSMQKPGAAPGATPAAGAGSQVKPGDVAEGSVTPNITVNKVHDDGHEKEWHIYRGKEMIGYVIKNQPDTAEGLYIAYGHGPGRAFVKEVAGLKPAVNYIASLKEGMAEAEAPQHFAQSSPLSSNNRGVLESKKGVNPFAKKEETDKKKCPPMSHIKKMCQDRKSVAEICKMHPDCDQKELKQMVADCKKKLSEASMPMKKVDGKNVPAFAADGKGKNDLTKKGAAPKKGVNPFAKKDEKKKVKEGMGDDIVYSQYCSARDDGNTHEQAVADISKRYGDAPQSIERALGFYPKYTPGKFYGRPTGKPTGLGTRIKSAFGMNEGMDSKLQAARLRGKSHALSKEAYNCHYDDMEESRHYHDGFKEGLDECYGQMPILGRTSVGESSTDNLDWKSMITPTASIRELRDMFEEYNLPRDIADFLEYAKDARNLGQAMAYFDKKSLEDEDYGNRVDDEYGADITGGYYHLIDLMDQGASLDETEVGTMASYGADKLGEMDKTSYMKQQAIKTPGNSFKAFGQTMRDNDVLDEFAFEALDKQLNAILEDKKVSEGMTVSISKGQQGSPDSVSVSAQDGEADQLLSIIKSAGMGLFGGDEQNGYGAPQGSAGAHGGINVVDDHDGMMALMKKLSGNGEMQGGGDYEDEEGSDQEGHMHGHEETCESCGEMMEENHQCESDEQSVMGEDESEDQMAYEVAEANAPDSGADNTNADVAGNAAANSALATADAGADEEEGKIYSSPTEGMEDTTGEEAGTDALDEEGYYKDPDGDEDSAEDKADKADHERRSREEEKLDEADNCKKCDCNPCKCETVAESFANLYKKLAFLSEESTSEKDAKAEKAGKKVAKDIEYDEGHKGKDDNKAEKAGKKVTKDIEYDDKKDKKVDESYANSADDTFEADIDFMTKVISGGLNRQKSTGQTTIPVIAGQRNRMGVDGLGSPMKESTDLLKDYMKLSGL